MLADGTPDNMAWFSYHHVISIDGRMSVQRVHDGAWVFSGPDPEVGEWGRYKRWVEKGNVPEEIDLRTEIGKQRFKECDIQASKYHHMRKIANEEAAKRVSERVALERSVNNG
jgi:hypothetical protein